MTFFESETGNIYIFKTSLKYKKDIKKVAPLLKKEPRIRNWNVDIDDIDKVLRIEANDIHAQDIMHLVRYAGYTCDELLD